MNREKIIITKISPPRLHSVFKRTRLFDLIDQCRHHPVTWISGLPGSGKTTLAASYLESLNISSIWYQMDQTDSNPANFFHYMSEAANRAVRSRSLSLPRLSPEHFINLPYFALQYFRELFASLKKPCVIVLDNYHEVSSGSELHRMMNAGLEQVPPGLDFVILSRTPPPPAMTRLLLNKKMVTIPAGELTLTRDESLGIAALHDKWKSGLESIPMILEHTGGWTAGFMVMLEYTDPGDRSMLSAREMAREFFFKYFAGEIFHKMDRDVQDFLLKTACMPSFTPAAAKKLTGFDGAGRVLADMHRKNYFTEKKVLNGTSYQFHPLFREFLLSMAEELSDPEDLMETCGRAAAILAEHGRLEDAFLLYAKSGDHAAQADLIRVHGHSLVNQGRLQTVGQWLLEVPPEIRASDPWLLFWHGRCRLPFDPLESRSLYDQAHDLFRKHDDATGLLLCVTGIIETILTEWGDFTQMDPWIAELNHLISKAKDLPSSEIEARAVIAMFAALMYRQPQHPDIKLWEKRAFELLRSDMDNNLRLLAGSYLSHYSCWTGDIFRAGVVIDIMDELMKDVALSPLDFMTVKMQKAVHKWFIADYQGCLEAVDQGLAEAENSGIHLIDNWLLAQGVYATLSLGDPEKAKTFLDRMKPVLHSRRYLDISHFYYLSSMYHVQKGNMERALHYIKESLQIARNSGTPFPVGLNAITAAQIYFERGDTEKAQELTMQARNIGRDMQSHLLDMLSSLNEAYFALKTGKPEQARESLRTALVMRRDKGIMNFSGWSTRFMRQLYAEALRSGIEVEFVSESITRRDMPPGVSSSEIINWPWRIRIYTLGRFALVIDGEPLRFKGKPQLKPLELLKALIALGGREIGLNRLEDFLWPEAEGDRARQSLLTTLHRLRKLAGYEKAIELKEMKLSLDERYCWVDVLAFESLCTSLEQAFAAERFTGEKMADWTGMILDLYRGDFLQNEEIPFWVAPVRTKIRSRFLQAVTMLGQGWQRLCLAEKAVDLYLRGLAVDDMAEEFYQGLMRCYLQQGRTADGLALYERCREVLAAGLQTRPSAETEALRLALRQEGTKR